MMMLAGVVLGDLVNLSLKVRCRPLVLEKEKQHGMKDIAQHWEYIECRKSHPGEVVWAASDGEPQMS